MRKERQSLHSSVYAEPLDDFRWRRNIEVVARVAAQTRAGHASSNFWFPRGTEVDTVQVFRPHNWDTVES